jgi:4-hydroxyphenylpyruvate dioxygenase
MTRSEMPANPMGTDGFEVVEFTAPDPGPLAELFERLGFGAVARHRERDVVLYRQGAINFLLNREPRGFAASFAAAHGPSACGFGIRVKDAQRAYERALAAGAAPAVSAGETLALDTPAIAGIGGSALYLVDRYGWTSVYARDYERIPGADPEPRGVGLAHLDHLTHNVERGNMNVWAGYYERLFNFREIRYFDIKGEYTGLFSRAMTSPDGRVRIPINESADDKSQIQEYLDQYRGEGIQHIALFTPDIYATVEALRANGVDFMSVPETYYEMVNERIPGHSEDLERMQENRILIDADPDARSRQLLQIFTQTCIGPIFFEIIQRKGNEGFGEGNFRALFESIERDQQRRGVI